MLFRGLLLVLLVPYVGWLVLGYEYHVLDHVNLAVHEAGHLLALPAGQMAHMLGGSLLQLVIPALFVLRFAWRFQRFEAAVCGIWLGESLLYLATYVGDAQAMALPLVGGHLHDWNWLLSQWGLLAWCRPIAMGVHALAFVVLVVSLGVAANQVRPRGDAVPARAD